LYHWYLYHLKRPILAFFRMPGARTFGILLVLFLVIIVLAVIDLHLNYVNPDTGKHLDPVAATYFVMALLVFESPLPLPDSWITRLAFFAVPIAGILVLGQGIIRLSSTLINKDLWNRAMASTYVDHTIVCGLGKVSLIGKQNADAENILDFRMDADLAFNHLEGIGISPRRKVAGHVFT